MTLLPSLYTALIKLIWGGVAAVANSQPTLAVYNNELYITWVTNGSGSNTMIESVSTAGGSIFQSNTIRNNSPDGAQPQTGAAVAMTPYNGQLYYAYQAQGNWNHEVVVCHATTSSNTCANYPSLQTHSGIAADTLGNSLYLSYKDPSSNNYLFVTGTEDGTTFTTPATQYPGIRINGSSEIAPAMSNFLGALYFLSVSNDGDHNLNVNHN